jgi:hypothetical protein
MSWEWVVLLLGFYYGLIVIWVSIFYMGAKYGGSNNSSNNGQ